MKYYGSLALFFILIPIFLSGCGGGGSAAPAISLEAPIRSVAEAQQRSTWTVLIYLDADNDLESAGIHNFNQMEMVGSTKDVHVIVQMARESGTDPSNEHWTGARRYLITRDSNSAVMNSIRLDSPPLGNLDMGDWHTLKNFVEWGVQQFPADHYCLIIWDHGTGWTYRSLTMTPKQPQFKYIAEDDTTGSQINITDIPNALTNVNMDVIAFDACFMQEIEVAYELRSSSHYMVGSVDTEPSPGYNYSTILSRMSGNTTPDQLCRIIVDGYAQEYPAPQTNISQCAIDLSRIGNVTSAADGFAQMLINDAQSSSAAALQNARILAIDYSTAAGSMDRHNIDLMDYAKNCDAAVGPNADSAYATLKSTLQTAIIDEYHSPDLANSCGISIYVPPRSNYDLEYNRLKIATDTQWDTWIRAQPQ